MIAGIELKPGFVYFTDARTPTLHGVMTEEDAAASGNGRYADYGKSIVFFDEMSNEVCLYADPGAEEVEVERTASEIRAFYDENPDAVCPFVFA